MCKGDAMLFYPKSFTVTTPTDRELQIVRDFHAPRALLFEAFTKPELVRRGLLGPDGWTMPVCEIDLRVGGAYRYVWKNERNGNQMGLRGTFREVVRTERVVATEKFDESWYPGEAVNTTIFEDRGDTTRATVIVLYESREARDTASRSGMERGMAAGYNRLEELLQSMLEKKTEGTPLIEVPEITEAPARLAAAIHLTIPRSEIRSAMGPGLSEIMTAVHAQGIGPAGPWFTHHFKMNPATFDFEICVPVSAPVTPVGRVVSRDIPAVRVARTIYRGSYEQLATGWQEFAAWMATNGHVPGPDLYECYLVGPESNPGTSAFRTELSRPLSA
jgi:uncharacterized protein YndB with AHSA1/START domain/effector-binding domain-containing protein